MDEFRRLEAKGFARAKLRAKRRRIRAIRARAIVGSVVLFAVAWAIVFGQLVTGNDPVLDRGGRPVASIHRRTGAKAARPVRKPEAEVEVVPAPPAAQPEPEPEAEAAPEEVEIAPEPEPAPVVTSAS